MYISKNSHDSPSLRKKSVRSQVLLESVQYVGCFETGVHCWKCKKIQSHWPKWRSIFWMFVENPTNWLIWLANVGQGYTYCHLHPVSVNCLQLDNKFAHCTKESPSINDWLASQESKKTHPSVNTILPEITSIPPLEESDVCAVFGILPKLFFSWNSNLHNGSRKKTAWFFGWLPSRGTCIARQTKLRFLQKIINRNILTQVFLTAWVMEGFLGVCFFHQWDFKFWYLLQCGNMWWRYPEWIRFSWACPSATEILILPFFPHGGQVIWTRFPRWVSRVSSGDGQRVSDNKPPN